LTNITALAKTTKGEECNLKVNPSEDRVRGHQEFHHIEDYLSEGLAFSSSLDNEVKGLTLEIRFFELN
jgi:hypothetical protein